MRVAQDALGAIQRDVTLWQRQETTLADKLQAEQTIVQDLTATITAAQATDKRQRQAYCHQLATLNHELGVLLQQNEQQRLLWLMHPETVADSLTTLVPPEHQDALAHAVATLQAVANDYWQVDADKTEQEDVILATRRRILEEQQADNNNMSDGEAKETSVSTRMSWRKSLFQCTLCVSTHMLRSLNLGIAVVGRTFV